MNMIIPASLDLTTDPFLFYTSVPPNMPRLFKNNLFGILTLKVCPYVGNYLTLLHFTTLTRLALSLKGYFLTTSILLSALLSSVSSLVL